MAQAFLFEPVCQPFIITGQKAVRSQDAFEFLPQDLDHHINAAIIPDSIDCDLFVGEDPQPGRQRADPPTRFIGMYHNTAPYRFDQWMINRPGGLGQTLVGLTPATLTHLQTKSIVE